MNVTIEDLFEDLFKTTALTISQGQLDKVKENLLFKVFSRQLKTF